MKKVAVIGCGYWGKNLARNFYDLNVLGIICDSDPGKADEITERYKGVVFTQRHSDVFSSPDIESIVIATPAETHYSLVKEALINDKDVFVEKPLALKYEDGAELVELAKRRKKILMVDHLLHYHSAIIELKKLINAGRLGSVQYIYSNRLNIGKVRKEENILWSFAPHDISVILGITGKMPLVVDAFGEAYLQKDIYDTTLTTLVFSDKLKAHIFVSWLHPFKEQKLVVIGTENMAVFDDQSEDKLLLYPHKVEWVNGVPVASKAKHKSVSLDIGEPLNKACVHFIECTKQRRAPLTGGEEALRVLKVLNEAQEKLEKMNYGEKEKR